MIEGRRNALRGRCALLGALMLWLLTAPTAGALSFIMGGIDAESQYTGAGTRDPEAGILTFDDQPERDERTPSPAS